ncbi:hypothetical protein [Bradyrhizobium ivorense]|uniref:hypothetical protein n=1 Tax=Bradyrhizobium ivorense TaxID=2511166 RepID=UPI00155AAD1D|nr:hypothetical protein [Bradyrhizobium ivorense]
MVELGQRPAAEETPRRASKPIPGSWRPQPQSTQPLKSNRPEAQSRWQCIRVSSVQLNGLQSRFDGLERISTQTLMDILEVPQRDRTAGAYRHLATLMVELGWTAVRVRDFARGGYKEQVRGYVRPQGEKNAR